MKTRKQEKQKVRDAVNRCKAICRDKMRGIRRGEWEDRMLNKSLTLTQVNEKHLARQNVSQESEPVNTLNTAEIKQKL